MIRLDLPHGLKSALLLAALLAAPFAAAEETSPNEALRQGLYQEEVKRDPEAAAKHYAEIIAAEDRRRATVATAIFRLAEVRRGQGKKDEAVALYQKLLREHPTAEVEGNLAREHLEKLGGKVPAAGSAAEPDAETKRLDDLRKMLANSPDQVGQSGFFVQAVVADYPRVIEALLDAGQTPPDDLLINASAFGRRKIVGLLLEKGGAKVRSGINEALAAAVSQEKLEIARALIAAGADPNWQPESCPREYQVGSNLRFHVEGPALYHAISSHNAGLVNLLLENKADPKLAAHTTGHTPLHAAAKWGENPALVTRLLDLGADVNALTTPSDPANSQRLAPRSPLQAAVDYESLDIAKLLIARGADLKQPDLFAPFDPNINAGEEAHKKAAGQVAFLLDAGAPVGDDPYPLISRMAPADPDGSRVKKLLANNPPPPDLTNLPDLSRWPEPARAAFLEAAVYPALARLPGVKLLFADTGVWKTAWDPTQGGEPPSAFELVWENRDAVVSLSESAKQNREAFRHLGCIMMRPQPDGSCVEVEKHGGPDTIPLDRDMIVISRSDRGRVENDGVYQEFSRQVTAQLRQMVAFPVTLEIGGEAREIRLRGDRLVFDPTVAEAPLLNAGPLARLFIPTTGGHDGGLNAPGKLRIQRKGWADLNLTLGSTESEKFALRRGDRIVVTESETAESLARTVDENGKPRQPYQVVLTTPGVPFARILGVIRKDRGPGSLPFAAELPTLLEAITDCYAGPAWSNGDYSMMSMFSENKAPDYAAADDQALFRLLSNQTPAIILPHPDFSAIRIRRLGKDGKETIIKVDLAAEIARCTDATDPAKAREADRPLQPGDIVEVPLKPAKDQPWTGLAAPEVRFFRKALTRRILVNLDNEISPMELAYQPPRWRQTAFGLLPLPPATGFATFRLSQVDMLLDKQFREEERKRMASASFGGGSSLSGGSILLRGDRNLSNYSDSPDRDPFVRDGDTVNARYTNHAPRPRVVAPPAPPGAQPSTQPIPRPTRR